ncbi:hypothetical protein EJ08DRAFT_647311 [Tothia fuscella]|uniref:Uncharacterized protein n=1 Tax=Tothia fuscella TaxID=1048955 RepID=A0A9P4NXS8_9PEZI|nr:hypothetical protein EJ08DRAFT_647311 [Tothia fuscella]
MAIQLRAPSKHTIPNAKPPTTTLAPPTSEWLSGQWQVTHSTLPMWKNKSDVRITYTPLLSTTSSSSGPPNLDDLVQYKKSPGPDAKDSSVHGVSRIAHVEGLTEGWAYNWRGKGLLAIASSKWEVLGYGEEVGSWNKWAVTYFSKTPFTPAGIDVYSRGKGVDEPTSEGIKAAFAGMEDEGLRKLAGEIFEIEIPA